MIKLAQYLDYVFQGCWYASRSILKFTISSILILSVIFSNLIHSKTPLLVFTQCCQVLNKCYSSDGALCTRSESHMQDFLFNVDISQIEHAASLLCNKQRQRVVLLKGKAIWLIILRHLPAAVDFWKGYPNCVFLQSGWNYVIKKKFLETWWGWRKKKLLDLCQ